MQIIDISKDIAKCEIYPGDPPVKMKRTSDISRGDLYNLTEITTGLHNGTHYDAPLHFIKDGHSAEKADLSVFIGECWVVETPAGAVTGEFVNKHFPKGAKRVLMKGGGKSYLLESAAEEIAFGGVRLLGTDALSVGAEGTEAAAHNALLRENVAVLESLDLENVKEGKYFLLAQPLKISGAEAAPVRAVLIGDFIFWSGTKA